MKVCVVIPTYNERENIRELIPQIERILCDNGFGAGYVVAVDDASPDGTGELAEQLAEEYGNIMVLHRRAKLGIGSAYREAFSVVLKSLEVDVFLEMDADLSHDPAYIPNLVKKLDEGYDVAIGSRYVEGGGINIWSATRRAVSKAANLLASELMGVRVKDMTSGFRAYKVSALRSIGLKQVRSEGYAFQIEVLDRCAKAGLKMTECPIIFKERTNGKSKLSKRAVLEYVGTLLSITLQRFVWQQNAQRRYEN